MFCVCNIYSYLWYPGNCFTTSSSTSFEEVLHVFCITMDDTDSYYSTSISGHACVSVTAFLVKILYWATFNIHENYFIYLEIRN